MLILPVTPLNKMLTDKMGTYNIHKLAEVCIIELEKIMCLRYDKGHIMMRLRKEQDKDHMLFNGDHTYHSKKFPDFSEEVK